MDGGTSKTLPKIPKKNVAKELLTDYGEKDSFDREHIEDLINQCAGLRNNPETGYDLEDMKHVNNPALEKDFNQSIETFRMLRRLHNLDKKIDKEYFYMAESEEEMLKIVRNGFQCEASDRDDKNLLGSSRYGFHLLKNLDVGLKYFYSKKIKQVYVIVVKTYFSNFHCAKSLEPSIFKHENYYPDLNKGMTISSDLIRDDLPIETNYGRSLAYLLYTEDMGEPLTQMKNLLPTTVLKFKQTNPSVFDPSIFTRVKSKYNNTKAKKTTTVMPERRPGISVDMVNIASITISKQPTMESSDASQPRIPRIIEAPPHLTPKKVTPSATPANKTPQPEPDKQIDQLPVDEPSLLPSQPLTTSSQDTVQLSSQQASKSPPPDIVKPVSIPPPIVVEPKAEPIELELNRIDSDDDSFTSSSSESDYELPTFEQAYADHRHDFASVIESLYEKPSKWRIMFEKTGRMDYKFRGVQKLQVVLGPDLKTMKNLVYSNPERTIINTKHSTNALILKYSSIKKKLPTTVVGAKLPSSSSSDSVATSLTSNPPKKPASTTSRPTNSQSSVDSAGSGSEMTSLEKKLMSKPVFTKIKEEPIQGAATTTAPAKPNPPPSNARLKMLLEQNKKEKQQAEQRLNAIKARQSQISKELEPLSASNKETRRTNFWEPDSDSEFGLEKRLLGKGEEIDEDIIILSRSNMPTFECSKQFYDQNMELFETQLKYFVNSVTPLSTSLAKGNCTVTAKTPIASSVKTSTTPAVSSRRSIQNEQKFIHYITVNNLSAPITKFDVDVLAKKSSSLNKVPSSLNTELEIYSAGFRCIKEHVFQRTNRYIRRVKSFQLLNPPSLGDLTAEQRSIESSSQPESSSALKKISLNDYSNRAQNRPPQTTSSSQPPAEIYKSNDDSTTTNMLESNNSLDLEANSTNSQDNRSFNTINQLRICDLTNLTNTQLPTPPTLHNFNKSHHSNLPTLSLMDEVKKRINQSKLDEKSLSNSRDNENSSDKEEESKKRHQKRAKKRKLSKKVKKKSKHGKKKSKKSRIDSKRVKNDTESGEAENEDSDASMSDSSTNYSISSLSCSTSSVSISDMSVSSSSSDDTEEKLGGYSVSSTSISSVDIESRKRKKKADKKRKSKRVSHQPEATEEDEEEEGEIKQAEKSINKEPEIKNEPEEEEEGEINDSDVEDNDKPTSLAYQPPTSLATSSQPNVQLKRSHNDPKSSYNSEWPAKSRTKSVEPFMKHADHSDIEIKIEHDDKPAKSNTSFSSQPTDSSTRFDTSTNQDKRDYPPSNTSRHTRTFTNYNNANNIINNSNKYNNKLNKSFGHETKSSNHHLPPYKSFNQFNNNTSSNTSHSKFATSMNQPLSGGGGGGLLSSNSTPTPLLNSLPGLYSSYPKPLLDNFMPTGSPNFPRQSVNLNHSDSFSSSNRGFNFSQSQSRLHAQRYNNNTNNLSGGKRSVSGGSSNNNTGSNYHNQFRFAPSYSNNREDKDEGEIV